MSGRMSLTMSQSLSPYPTLEPIPGGGYIAETQSASLAQAEREIKTLTAENKRLREELEDVSSSYKQLITENSHEKYDERRVNLLKAQMIQLERQVLLLNEALSSREGTLLDVENSLAAIATLCRNYTSKKDGRIGEVQVSKDDMIRIIETAESSRIKLFKNIENTSKENTDRPVAMFDKFLRHSSHSPPTLLDVCSGKVEHLNLKHVAKLESQLSLVYKQLMSLNESLQIIVPPGTSTTKSETNYKSANQHIPRSAYVRLGVKVTRSCNLLKDVTQELAVLNVLVPSAPWPALKRPLIKELTTANIMASLPAVPRSKVKATQQVIESLVKAINYSNLVTNAQTKSLKEEVKFHQEIYEQQQIYIAELFQSLRKGYTDFQDDTNTLFCKPMKDILKVYEHLKRTSSEDSLKYFLQVFKDHSDQMNEAVERLSDHLQNGEGEEAISSHGDDLFLALDKLCTEQQKKRDEGLLELDSVTHQYDLLKDELAMAEAAAAKQNESDTVASKNVENSGFDSSRSESKLYRTSDNKSLDSHDQTKDNFENNEVVLKPERSASQKKRRGSMNREPDASHHQEKSAASVETVEWRPPKPVKGVPQAKLKLKATGKKTDVASSSENQHARTSEVSSNRKSVSFPVTTEILPSPFQVHQGQSEDDETLHGYHGDSRPSSGYHREPSSVTNAHRRNSGTDNARPRSGSLSRLGQRSIVVEQAEPLVSTAVHKRYSSGQNVSKPWK